MSGAATGSAKGNHRRLADAHVADPLVDRVRGRVGEVGVEEAEAAAAVEQAALADENVQRFVAGQNIVKLIVVPGKLVNVVVK